MKYIDEGVKIKISGFNIAKSAQYRYTVYWSGDAEPFFDGYCYLLKGQTEKEFDITDIIKSHNISTFTDDYSMLYTTYSIVLMVDEVNYTNQETIANIYRYPNRKLDMETDFANYDGSPMLQGFNGRELKLTPHYPILKGSTFKFDLVYFNRTLTEKSIIIYNNQYPVDYSPENSVLSKSMTIGNLIGDRLDPTDIKFDTGFRVITVAVLDVPHSRYYLKWRDRYGSFQCQPFCKTTTYSEGLDKKQLLTYDLHKKIYSVDITPTWKINSGWIDQELYPYFESIFISNYVELYDTKEDISYVVIVKDSDYTEKTVRNQGRSLFNLELTLELNKNQSILY